MPIEKQPYLPGFEDSKNQNQEKESSKETIQSNEFSQTEFSSKIEKLTPVEIENQANKLKNKALRMLKKGQATENFDGVYQIITYQDKDKTIQVKRKYKKYLVEVAVSNNETYILRYGRSGWMKIIGGLEATLNNEEFEKLSKEQSEPKGPITFIDKSSKKFDNLDDE